MITFQNLEEIAIHLRGELDAKKFILLFAYNGTGKTRLSMAFREQHEADEERDTLYFNAFTEDLFYWNNDLENESRPVLRVNHNSRFFNGLQVLEMESRIVPLLARYTDISFLIDYDRWEVVFFRENDTENALSPIKVSRGEESIFIWCFFLAIAQLAIDEQESYRWVKYIFIDDPISSLDDNNAIAVANHLAELLRGMRGNTKTVISSHHTLFFNVMWNELRGIGKNFQPYFLSANKSTGTYSLRHTNDSPFYHHIALLEQLHAAAESNQLYTFHFNILRSLLEKTASFHGFKNFSACIKRDADDVDGGLHARMINVLSHGNYSLFEPREMLEENKQYFKKILNNFMANYRFNPELFPAKKEET